MRTGKLFLLLALCGIKWTTQNLPWWYGCRRGSRLTRSSTIKSRLRALTWPILTSTPSMSCWSVWRGQYYRSKAADSPWHGATTGVYIMSWVLRCLSTDWSCEKRGCSHHASLPWWFYYIIGPEPCGLWNWELLSLKAAWDRFSVTNTIISYYHSPKFPQNVWLNESRSNYFVGAEVRCIKWGTLS